jgi:hypothetical protein
MQNPLSLKDFKLSSLRGAAGFFRVAPSTAGRWWLIDPEDRPCFPAAVAGAASAPLPGSRLRGWGFGAVTTLGAGAGGPAGLLWLPVAGVSRPGPFLRFGGARIPDVFDPSWAEIAADQAKRVCAVAAEDRSVLGWKLDEGLDWAWDEPEGRPTLLQLCLSLEPRHAAYHAAWEFVLALHEGSFDRLAEDWQVPLTNKELLRAWTREERGVRTPGYQADHRLWSEECARRYAVGAAAAVRAADPQHLVFAPGLARAGAPPWWAEVVGPAVDVMVRRWPAPEWAEGAGAGTGGGERPTWVEGFCWADPQLYEPPPAAGEPPEWTRLERMLGRGRAALRRLATEPAVVGWSWPRWGDAWHGEGVFGPGLVRSDGSDAIEHTEALTWINAQTTAWRTAGSRRSETPAG